MKKIITISIMIFTLLNADKLSRCQWAQNEFNILTKELQHNIDYGTTKSKQDTFNKLADVVEYELIADCRGIVPKSTLLEVVNGLHGIKKRAKLEGWWYEQ